MSTRRFTRDATLGGKARRLRPVTGLALALMMATACEDQPTTATLIETADVWRFAQAPMAAGGLHVTVSGLPFGGPQAALQDAVISEMTQAATWTATPLYTTDADTAGDRSVRVFVSFNGGDRRPCDTASPQPGGGPRPDGRVDILATLCANDKAVSQVAGHVTGADGRDDPRFTALIRQTTRTLLRSERRNDR